MSDEPEILTNAAAAAHLLALLHQPEPSATHPEERPPPAPEENP